MTRGKYTGRILRAFSNREMDAAMVRLRSELLVVIARRPTDSGNAKTALAKLDELDKEIRELWREAPFAGRAEGMKP